MELFKCCLSVRNQALLTFFFLVVYLFTDPLPTYSPPSHTRLDDLRSLWHDEWTLGSFGSNACFPGKPQRHLYIRHLLLLIGAKIGIIP